MAIAIDAVSASTGVTSVSSVTTAHTIAAATEELNISVGARVAQPSTGNTVSTVTYNGAACLHQRDDTNNATSPDTFSGRTEIWTIVNPATGTHNVVVTWTGTVTYGGSGHSSFSGVDQTTPVDATNGATGTSLTISVGITTGVANAYLVDALYSRSGTITKDASQTTIANISIAADDSFGASYKSVGASGSYTMDWTESNDGNDWVISVLSLKPATAATAIFKGLIGAGFIPTAR